MNLLSKLDYLMSTNNLNKRTLSQLADIPYTTIDGLYKKGYENVKLSTLKKLAKYFNVSLDYLIDDNITTIISPPTPLTNLTQDQIECLVNQYQNAPTPIRTAINKLLDINSE